MEVRPPASQAVRFEGSNHLGNQVGYNYGTIAVSVYAYHSLDAFHEGQLPDLTTRRREALSLKLKRGRELYKEGRAHPRQLDEAKRLFYEVLRDEQSSDLDSADQLWTRYYLGRVHHARAEFAEADPHFLYVTEHHDYCAEDSSNDLSDARYWRARGFYGLKEYEKAVLELRTFLLSHAAQDLEKHAEGKIWLGMALVRLAEFGEAGEQFQDAYMMCEERLGSSDLNTLSCRHHLANFLYNRASYDEARAHYDQLLEIEGQVTGPETSEVVRTRCMLALSLSKLGDLIAAEPHLKIVHSHLDSRRSLQRAARQRLFVVSFWLGRIYLMDGQTNDPELSKRRLQRALQEASSLGSENGSSDIHVNQLDNIDVHDELMDCRWRLAQSLRRLGDHVQAEQRYREALIVVDSTREEAYVACHHGLAASLWAQQTQAKSIDARLLLEEVVNVSTSLSHCRHTGVDLAACLHLLAKAYYCEGRLLEAKVCLQRVIDARPRIPTIHYRDSLHGLARVLFDLGQYDRALQYFQESQKMLEDYFPRERFYHYQDCALICWCLCEKGDIEFAERDLREILSNSGDFEPTRRTHYVVSRTHYYLGRLLCHTCPMRGAVEELDAASSMLSKSPGRSDPAYLKCQYYLASAIMKTSDQGSFQPDKHNRARSIFQSLQESSSADEKVEHIRIVLAPFWLSQILFMERRNSEAQEGFSSSIRYVRTIKDIHNASHPEMTIEHMRYWQARNYSRLKNYDVCISIMREILSSLGEAGPSQLTQYCQIALGEALYFNKQYNEACDFLSTDRYSQGIGLMCAARLRGYLADCLARSGRIPDAEGLISEAAQQSSKSLPAAVAIGKHWQGRMALSDGRHIFAKECFLKARDINQSGDSWNDLRKDNLHFLARTHLHCEQYTDAISILDNLIRQQKQSGDVESVADNRYWLATALYHNKNRKQAMTILEATLSDGNSGRLVENIASSCHALIELCLYEDGKNSEALDRFKTSLHDPNKLPLFPWKVGARLYLAHCYHRLSRHEEAHEAYEAIPAVEPMQICRRHFCLGRSSFHLKRWDEARNELKAAEELVPSQWVHKWQFQYYLGLTYMQLGMHDEAIPYLRAAQVDRNKALSTKMYLESRWQYGAALYETSDYKGAKDILEATHKDMQGESSIETDRLMSTKYYLGRCLLQLKSHDDGRTMLEDALSFFQSQPERDHDKLAQVQYELGRDAVRRQKWSTARDFYKNALSDLEQAGSSSGLDRLRCQYELAHALRKTMEYGEAVPLYRTVIREESAKRQLSQLLIDAQAGLSHILCFQAQFDEALPLIRSALEGQEISAGREDVSRLPILLTLARVEFNRGEHPAARNIYEQTLAQMESSKKAKKAVAGTHTAHYAIFALCLLKAGQKSAGKERAMKLLKEGGFKDIERYAELKRFAEKFGLSTSGEPIGEKVVA